jgi:hypothetical protein
MSSDRNPPQSPQELAERWKACAEALGADPADADEVHEAFSALHEHIQRLAADYEGDAQPSDPDGSENDGAEGVAPPMEVRPRRLAARGERTTPKVTPGPGEDRTPAGTNGGALMGSPDPEDIRRGMAAMGWKTPAPTPTAKSPSTRAPGGGVDGPQGISHPKQTSR